ncbi:VOC family protein [Thiofilum flexile]|uniref:VOC family protein n=1 Tax=Thiofilum flexile TaxID=125627 RepID=UPI000365A06F|nr:VOC family protein [Thiofilum flexile]
MKPNPVVWFEIYVQDMERAQAFYEAMLQIKLEPLSLPDSDDSTMEMRAFPMGEKTVGAGGALVKMEGVPSGGMGTLVYFSCEDCSVEAQRAAANGGSISKHKMAIGPFGFITLVQDTEGNMIGLHSMQ